MMRSGSAADETFQRGPAILGLVHVAALGAQHATPLLARVLIVLDDQNTKRGARRAGPEFRDQFPERFALDRLNHVISGTERVTPVPLIGDGEHHDGDIRELTIRLQFLQDAPAVAARHQHVEGDECRLHLPGQFEAFRTVLGRHYIATLADEKPAHLVPHRLIVINDEDHVRDEREHDHPPRPRKQGSAALPALGACRLPTAATR